jgi:TolB protein
MDADGSNQRRLTFGGGAHSAPDWSPDGEWIAFTRRDAGSRRIGIIAPDGSGERMLTDGPGDDGANWAASSRDVVFQRTDAGRRNKIYRVSVDGSEPRRLETPQDGADPDWSGVMD